MNADYRYRLSVYKTWAPQDSVWSPWAKPVLFAGMTQRGIDTKTDDPVLQEYFAPKDGAVPLDAAAGSWMTELDRRTAIIVDMPGKAGVDEAMALARLGYRPVPLYNGVKGDKGTRMLVDVGDIEKSLCIYADELSGLRISPDAPPVFMLDSLRMKNNERNLGTFDNRWTLFPQDLPSTAFFAKQGIRKIIVRGDGIQDDLDHILYACQKDGIAVEFCNGGEIKPYNVTKPGRFKSVSYRFQVIMGLKRNSAGGFGSKIPGPSSGSTYYGGSGVHYYRYG